MMPLNRLLGALLVIVLLAIVLPYAAVRILHGRRLTLAETELDRLAAAAKGGIASAPAVNVLLGAGRVPEAADARWQAGPTYPMESVLPAAAVSPDPWGNGYVINAGAGRSAVWLLSAGPNGRLDTPFDGASNPLGDDLGRRLR